MPINVHTIDPNDAYAETQTNDAIESGDTLVAGNVVGFLMDAWPVAVTVEAGEFHICSHADPEDLYTGSRMKPCAIAEAAQYASDNGFDVHPIYMHLLD